MRLKHWALGPWLGRVARTSASGTTSSGVFDHSPANVVVPALPKSPVPIVGGDRARDELVHGDGIGLQLLRQHAREHPLPGLGAHVRRELRHAAVADARSDEDDLAAAARTQARDRGPCAEVRRGEVHVEGVAPHREVGVGDRSAPGETARVQHHDVEPAELVDPREEVLDRIDGGHVGRDRRGRATGGLDLVDERVELGRGPRRDDDVRTGACIGDRDGATDARPAPVTRAT